MVLNVILFVFSAFFLWQGAGLFISGGTLLARRTGASPLIIGLTLGALGTSMPELVVSWFAAATGRSGIALGNAVGSNMANICLALGLGAAIWPVRIERDVITKDYWVLLASAVLLMVFSAGFHIKRVHGVILMLAGVIYLLTLGTRKNTELTAKSNEAPAGNLRALASIIIGLTLLLAGAKFMVDGAVFFSRRFGVAETAIALSAVAVGTSLPELAVVLAGSLKKAHQISVGTIIGSNIFNILFVAGGAAAISGIPLKKEEAVFQAPAVLLITLILFPIIITGRRVSKGEGTFLVAVFCGYLYLVLRFI